MKMADDEYASACTFVSFPAAYIAEKMGLGFMSEVVKQDYARATGSQKYTGSED
jgi:hypothetical protein